MKQFIIGVFDLDEANIHMSTYNTFLRKWYLDVGCQILLTYIISFVICPVFTPLSDKLLQLWRRYTAARKQLQKDMNQTLLDP